MATIPDRFLWAAELMNIRPEDNVLEIGCGAGLLAEAIAGRIETGSFMAVDRSVAMIEKAKKRNQKHLDRQISNFVATDFSESRLPSSHFDSIVAFNVIFFWKDPSKELRMIQQALKPGGKLYVYYQAPFEITISAADPVRQNLVQNAFDIIDVKLKKLVPTSSFCIISKPKGHTP